MPAPGSTSFDKDRTAAIYKIYVVNKDGTDIWTKILPGANADADNLQYGNWSWPGGAQLLAVFEAIAASGVDVSGADLTCRSAVQTKAGAGWEESDGFVWLLAPYEGGIAWRNQGITHFESWDWPQEGVLEGGAVKAAAFPG